MAIYERVFNLKKISKLYFTGLVILFFTLGLQTVKAQGIRVSGQLLDSITKEPLIGATLRLQDAKDTSKVIYTSSDVNGRFLFSNLYPIDYQLVITFVGYHKWTKPLSLSNKPENLGAILMQPGIESFQEIKVIGNIPMSTEKGDTTQYNARAFKTNSDASAGDLLKKIPGITVSNGTVTAQGETVQKVLVDGKPYFGNDPTIAIQNLPADIIDKVQVFDKLSDQAQFTGFDDGNSQKTINIITLPDKRHSHFGKIYAGYGNNYKNSEGGNINLFNGDQRISIIGLSNNINVQNFSTQDLLGVISSVRRRGGGMGMGRGRGRGGFRGGFGAGGQMSNFLVGQQNGITSTHSFGVNYNDNWGSKIRANGSYFFNMSNNANEQFTNRTYFLQNNSNQFYTENNSTNSDNNNNRMNMRIIYTPDKNNSVIFVPSFNFQNFKSSNDLNGFNFLNPTDSLSRTINNYSSKNHGYDLTNMLLIRHRFEKRGRTLSLNLQSSLQKNDGTNYQDAYNLYYQPSNTALSDTLDQRPVLNSNGYNVSSNLVYTEPIAAGSQLEVRYNIAYRQSHSNKETYNYDFAVQKYALLDTTLSNTFKNDYLTNTAGLAYRHRSRGFFYTLGIDYQNAGLNNNQTYPYGNHLTKTFQSILPNAMLMYRISQNTNLRFFFRTRTSAPSINQLQNVTDNTNPLQLTTGNPDLKEESSDVLITRFSHSNAKHSGTFFAMFFLTKTQNYISNSIIIAEKDTTLSNGIVLNQGSQFSQPVNLSGYWNFRTFLNYGFPIHFLYSNLNINSGFTYSRTPGLINNTTNISNEYNFTEGFVLGSNISKAIDFTIGYNANFDQLVNQIQPDLNNHYFYQTVNLDLSLTFWHGLVFRNNLIQQLYSGLSSNNNQTYYLWNMAIGKKIFKDHRGEFALSAYDILKQNSSINRTVTNTYLEDQTNQVLTRYFLLTFSYKI